MAKQRKGFNVMDPKLVKAIASLGGQASQASRRGHRWSPQEARMHRQAQLAKAREKELEGLYMRVRERGQASVAKACSTFCLLPGDLTRCGACGQPRRLHPDR